MRLRHLGAALALLLAACGETQDISQAFPRADDGTTTRESMPPESDEMPQTPEASSAAPSPGADMERTEETLRDAYETLSTTAIERRSIVPHISSTCRNNLGFVSDDDPLSGIFAEQSGLLLGSWIDGRNLEIVDVSIDGDTGTVTAGREYPAPFTFIHEDGTWRFGKCTATVASTSLIVPGEPTENSLTARIELIRSLATTDQVGKYPWLSQRCRREAVERSVYPGLIGTSLTHFSEIETWWNFSDIEILLVENGFAMTTQLDELMPTLFDGRRASHWVFEYDNWFYDGCLQPGEDYVPLGEEPGQPKLEDLHRPFFVTPLAMNGLTEGMGSVNPGVRHTARYEIDQPTTEDDAHVLLRAELIPAMAEAGYTVETELDGYYSFLLDANPCGRADAVVVWPAPGNAAPKEIVVGLFKDGC